MPLDLKKLIPLYIGAAIGPMGGFGIVTILPVLAQSWSVAFSTAAVAITFYMVPFIIIQIFSGAIAQLFDVRKTLLFGFSLYTVGAVLSGTATGLGTFLTYRIVQGVGAGFLTPIIMALIGELVAERHMGKAIGMLGVAYTIGVTLGPFLSGMIEVRLGWPWFFYFLALLAFTAGASYALTSQRVVRPAGTSSGLLDVVALLKRALREPGVIGISFAAFTLFLAYVGVMTFTADYLKSGFGLPSDKVGVMLSITGFSGIFASPMAGFLGDRLGRRRVFLMGTAVAVCAVALMLLAGYSYSGFLLFFLLLGTGAATAWTSLNTMAVQLSIELRQPVTSVYNAIKFSGYALSPAVLSLIYAPFGLKSVQAACIIAIVMASVLAATARNRPAKTETGLY
ncbi:MAG: MFS transporter [Desulfobacteraceae bacterium]|nr:MAG: MFS transporter [Desulfobacteraceae bacterium]